MWDLRAPTQPKTESRVCRSECTQTTVAAARLREAPIEGWRSVRWVWRPRAWPAGTLRRVRVRLLLLPHGHGPPVNCMSSAQADGAAAWGQSSRLLPHPPQ